MDLPIFVQTFSIPRKLPRATNLVASDPENLMSSGGLAALCPLCTRRALASCFAFSKPRDLLMPGGKRPSRYSMWTQATPLCGFAVQP